MIARGRFNLAIMSPDARRVRHDWNPGGHVSGHVETTEGKGKGESYFHLVMVGAAFGFAIAFFI